MEVSEGTDYISACLPHRPFERSYRVRVFPRGSDVPGRSIVQHGYMARQPPCTKTIVSRCRDLHSIRPRESIKIRRVYVCRPPRTAITRWERSGFICRGVEAGSQFTTFPACSGIGRVTVTNVSLTVRETKIRTVIVFASQMSSRQREDSCHLLRSEIRVFSHLLNCIFQRLSHPQTRTFFNVVSLLEQTVCSGQRRRTFMLNPSEFPHGVGQR